MKGQLFREGFCKHRRRDKWEFLSNENINQNNFHPSLTNSNIRSWGFSLLPADSVKSEKHHWVVGNNPEKARKTRHKLAQQNHGSTKLRACYAVEAHQKKK